MTVLGLVRKRSYQGRTLLIGTPTDPVAWLAQPRLLAPHFALCFDRLDAIQAVHAAAGAHVVLRMASDVIRTHPVYREARFHLLSQRITAA